ncbi:hypothetical protein MTR_8g012670 [Medicago truncatula]|uniref:Uncharacterized protein n=1 Tax=Medicago truncatula TaxID=3880 RepID=A0A072TMQ9_MEDTR|nr:hypothetical protein MTR_8g012670 [Medicago truncatula]
MFTKTKQTVIISSSEPIWGWPSGWLGILEFAPPKVSGSIPSGANFGGLSPYRACSGFKRGPRKWAVGLVPSD